MEPANWYRSGIKNTTILNFSFWLFFCRYSFLHYFSGSFSFSLQIFSAMISSRPISFCLLFSLQLFSTAPSVLFHELQIFRSLLPAYGFSLFCRFVHWSTCLSFCDAWHFPQSYLLFLNIWP